MLWAIIVAIVIGIIAGLIARALMPGRDPMGLGMTALLGIVGAVLGYFLFRAIGIGDADKFDLGSLPGAIIGAMIVLFLYRKFVGYGDRGHGGRVATH